MTLMALPMASCTEQSVPKLLPKSVVLNLLSNTKPYGVKLLENLVTDNQSRQSNISEELLRLYPGLLTVLNSDELSQKIKQLTVQDIQEGHLVLVKQIYFSRLEHMIFLYQAKTLNRH